VRDARTAPFFDAAAAGRLAVRSCTACGRLLPPAAMACSACRSPALSWAEVSGDGSVVSWIVMHGRVPTGSPEGTAAPTAVIVTVELAEGPWINGRLIDATADDLELGSRVRVDFHRPAEGAGEPIPVFRLMR
jgi:hypothetical protein